MHCDDLNCACPQFFASRPAELSSKFLKEIRLQLAEEEGSIANLPNGEEGDKNLVFKCRKPQRRVHLSMMWARVVLGLCLAVAVESGYWHEDEEMGQEPVEFVGQEPVDFPQHEFGGQEPVDFPQHEFGGQEPVDFPQHEFGGQEPVDFPQHEFGGQEPVDFPQHEFGGQEPVDFPQHEFGGQEPVDFPQHEFGGQEPVDFPQHEFGGQEPVDFNDQKPERLKEIDELFEHGFGSQDSGGAMGQQQVDFHDMEQMDFGEHQSESHPTHITHHKTSSYSKHYHRKSGTYHGKKTVKSKSHGYGGSYGSGQSSYDSHDQMNECGNIELSSRNFRIRCIMHTCIASCADHHHFPNGESQLKIVCKQKHWKVDSGDYADDVIPSCTPTCLPACSNGGSCTAPNYCSCPDNFYGPYCQYESVRCSDPPPLSPSANAHRMCTNAECTVTCAPEHVFPDGSTSAELHCKDGLWRPVRRDWILIPDCKAVCSPPCQNGGLCLSGNTCHCPQEFRGAQCQYSASVCDVRSLGFNGNYNCSSHSDMETLQCSFQCPSGLVFAERPPSDVYQCSYATGLFTPHVLPHCVFDKSRDDELLEMIFPHHNSKYSTSHVYHSFESYEEYQRRLLILESLSHFKCYTWNSNNFRDFNGKVKNYQVGGLCPKHLMEGTVHFKHFRIDIPSIYDCEGSTCSYLTVQIGPTTYNFSVNASKQFRIHDGTKYYSAPQKFAFEKVEMVENLMSLHLDSKLSLLWDLKHLVSVQVEKSKLQETRGLCGIVKDHKAVQSIEVAKDYLGDCLANDEKMCSSLEDKEKAESFCDKMYTEVSLESCRKVLNPSEFYDACVRDTCACDHTDPDCGCFGFKMFAEECAEFGEEKPNWRSTDLCPMKCERGRVYQKCGIEKSCGGVDEDDVCSEGCFCPLGTVHHNGSCITKSECPCSLRGKWFPPGMSVPKDCNTCTCSNGKWVCTVEECNARCEAVGDPHYITFDKHSYEFMGDCSYTLVQTDNFTIETENMPCDGSISESLGLKPVQLKKSPTCTKSVTIKLGGNEIKLKQKREVTVNGKEHQIPLALTGAYIRRASSIFIQVHLDDGVDVMWDGNTRVYVHAVPSMKGKTKGLCGTYNGQQNDDFLTPEGDIEDDSVSFGNKWKTKDSCLPSFGSRPELADCPPELRAKAEEICNKLVNEDLFEDCDLETKAEAYRDFCLFDVCSCSHKLADCYCPIFSSFADRCSKTGYHIEWRSKMRECGIRCPQGQVYEICGNTCSRSCTDISRRAVASEETGSSKHCIDSCVEGCYCPHGYVMNSHEKCVPLKSCPCLRAGLEYPAGHREIRPNAKGPQLCICENAVWECHTASSIELTTYRNSTIEEKICSVTKHQVYSHCEPSTPVTCQNMNKNMEEHSEAVCYGGCVCKKGYVLDSITGHCVKPDDCPCHHGGRSYNDGQIIQKLCNTCSCKNGNWNCTSHACPATCVTWGESHFKTFDGKIYDFQGACEYVLAKGALSSLAGDCFSVIVELAPCGSTGASCTKSVTLNVGTGAVKETLVLADGHGFSQTPLNRILHRDSGLYVFVEVPELGMTLQWDKGTRVTVKVDPKWSDRVKGLCGNYNNDYTDDFRSPSGGSEPNIELFGDSWKIHDYCPNSEQVSDTCKVDPKRKEWSVSKCSILKSPIFRKCHSEVQVDPYLERCVFDVCGCDEGGDCNCLCTALAAYAQECNEHGVPIKWRSQELCPIQCDQTCSSYSPCVSTCPLETCNNVLHLKKLTSVCTQDTCVEGCEYKRCPNGEIYGNSNNSECIPIADCKPVCMTVNGVEFFEGDMMESDDCHRCYCSRHQKTCSGEPCSTASPTPQQDESPRCVSGWSEWINSHHHSPNNAEDEFEHLPHMRDFVQVVGGPIMGRCSREQMRDIRCRTVKGHLSNKETGEDAECSLERGLYCTNGCHDYEIQVLCECDNPKKTAVTEGTVVDKNKVVVIPDVIPDLHGCGPDQVWDECHIQCDQLCHFAHKVIFMDRCSLGVKCLAGCRPRTRLPCPFGKMWRDAHTCVSVEDCTCSTHNGTMLKPGEVYHLSDCTVCQCLHNDLTCDDSRCHETTTESYVTEDIIIIKSSVSPPLPCDSNDFVPLLVHLPDSAFTASSSLDEDHGPAQVKMNKKGGWAPTKSKYSGCYIQVDLGKLKAVYGVSVRGDPSHKMSVRSFQVLYSTDGVAYHYVGFSGLAELFKGPLSSMDTATHSFSEPIEARFVRVVPLTWDGAPVMKIELSGCERHVTSTTDTPTITTVTMTKPTTEREIVPMCTDRMSSFIDDRQISASSSSSPVTAELVSIYSDYGWSPLTHDKNQWLQFDFLDKRILTGVMTAGSHEEKSYWVSSFTLSHSLNGKDWNPVLDKKGILKVYKANTDNSNIVTNTFWEPIHARYIRIIPVTWHTKIAMRAQMMGCYKDYPTLAPLTTETPTTAVPPKMCSLCPGALPLESTSCPCSSDEWWSGEKCLARSQCPCFIGFISYNVGSVFDNEDCQQCVCGLNGVAQCKNKKCPPCETGLKWTLSSTCSCSCIACPHGQRLCPSSNLCLNESSWCDGVIDCSDDEINCPTTTTSPPIQTTECPPVECPEGYTVNVTQISPETVKETVTWSPFGTKSKWGSYFKGKGPGGHGKLSRKGVKGQYKSFHQKKAKVVMTTTPAPTTCPEYECTPIVRNLTTCPKPDCQQGYQVTVIEGENGVCPHYSCVLVQVSHPDAYCTLTGRTFQTFDGSEFKYDICHHVLAENAQGNWSVVKTKNCNGLPGPCLLITLGTNRIVFTKELDVWYNDYHYTVPQLQKIGAQNEEFAIRQISDSFIIFSSTLDFSVIWDLQGNVKVTVPGTLRGQLDGLCGYFDGHRENDLRKRDRTLSTTSVDFGDSWGSNEDCETIACPLHVQKEAFQMCKAFKDEPLSKCDQGVNLDKLMSQCVESICSCVERGNTTEQCRCTAILDGVTQCQNALPELDLSRWRMNNDCPVDCPPGLIYKECFTRTCEPCCSELMLLDEACPDSEMCFPGCYCPDGYVRQMDSCIRPSQCRDCKCDGMGASRIVTFDRMDYTYSGKCTHILAQTVKDYDGPQFTIFTTSHPCPQNPGNQCLHMVTILYNNHVVQVIHENDEKPTVKLDSALVHSLPYTTNWLSITESQGKCVTISITKLELDLQFFNQGKGFNLRLPSHLYEGKTEGLCGSCNLNGHDDFKLPDGRITENITEFGENWIAKDHHEIIGKEESCTEETVKTCERPQPGEPDPCQILLSDTFIKCHSVVDPEVHLEACYEGLCSGGSICDYLEAYSRQCQTEGICLSWRTPQQCPYTCPQGLVYEPCGLGCSITCDTYELYQSSPEKCSLPRGDSCACPPGQVIRNDSCIPERLCKPCDSEGHFPGDEWRPDPCTLCGCSKDSIQCQRIQCSADTVCSRGFKSMVVVGSESDCCPKHICIPEPTPGTVCPEPQQPECGSGQIMKLESNSAGCNEFICQCKPKEECEPTEKELKADREPGMVARLDESGCCPRVIVECRNQTCPPPPSCPEHHVPVIQSSDLCCPQFKCSIPEGKCLYEMSYISRGNGGERERQFTEKFSVLKSNGETWSDGPCRNCRCQNNGISSCDTVKCLDPPASDNYVYKAEFVNDKCCPIYVRTACKDNGKVYQVDQIWPSSDNNPCVNITCTLGPNKEVSKQEMVETCKKECKLGWVYEESTKGECCGDCVAQSCVIGSHFHPKGSIWLSSDNCTAFECLIENNQPRVVSSQEKCPDLKDCPENQIYKDNCCLKCNWTVPENLSNCSPESLSLEQTVKMVQVNITGHGLCLNTQPVSGFAECQGHCGSYTVFNSESGHHDSKCTCCKPQELTQILVPLTCEDGFFVEKYIPVPEKCQCTSCTEKEHL